MTMSSSLQIVPTAKDHSIKSQCTVQVRRRGVFEFFEPTQQLIGTVLIGTERRYEEIIVDAAVVLFTTV